MSTINSGAKLLYGPVLESGYLNENYSLRGKNHLPEQTTIESDITAEAASIVGWNVQPTTFSTSNSIMSQINSNILTSFSAQTPSSPSANGYGLNRGAKIAIGVSAAVGIIFVVTLIAWTVILKRKSRNLSTKIEISEQSQTQSNDIISSGVFNSHQSCEHCSSRSHELGHENMRELDGSQIHELTHRNLCELDPIILPVELSVATP